MAMPQVLPQFIIPKTKIVLEELIPSSYPKQRLQGMEASVRARWPRILAIICRTPTLPEAVIPQKANPFS